MINNSDDYEASHPSTDSKYNEEKEITEALLASEEAYKAELKAADAIT